MWYSTPYRKPLKRLQRVQSPTACFVTSKFSKEDFVLNLGGLPMSKKRDWHLLTVAFKTLNSERWSEYAKLKYNNPGRIGLQSCSKDLLEVSGIRDTFQYSAAKRFNGLPQTFRAEKNFKTFYAETKALLFERAREGLG